jgi:hypothetical protein
MVSPAAAYSFILNTPRQLWPGFVPLFQGPGRGSGDACRGHPPLSFDTSASKMLAADLIWIDQIGEDIKCPKTRLKTCRDPCAPGVLEAADRRFGEDRKQMHQRLIAALQEHKVALGACARKFDIFANAAVGRKTAWLGTRKPQSPSLRESLFPSPTLFAGTVSSTCLGQTPGAVRRQGVAIARPLSHYSAVLDVGKHGVMLEGGSGHHPNGGAAPQ